MEALERRVVSRFGVVGLVAKADIEYIRTQEPGALSIVYIPYPISSSAEHGVDGVADQLRPTFVFSGQLGYLPNRDAVTQLVTIVWPYLRRRWPQARLRVVGASPGWNLARLITRAGGEVRSDVASVRAEIRDAAAMVVPMRLGGGVQTKILEAMSIGVPVICSAFANRGLGATPGKHVLIADSAEEYVRRAEVLVDDKNARDRIVRNALTWVSEHHSLTNFADALEAACLRVVGGSPQTYPD